MNRYMKLIPPLLAGIAMVVLTGILNAIQGDSLVDKEETLQIVIQGLTVIAVWGTANVPGWERGKTFSAAVFLVLSMLVTFISGGVNLTEWLNLGIAFLGALGVNVMSQPLSTSQAIAGRGSPGTRGNW